MTYLIAQVSLHPQKIPADIALSFMEEASASPGWVWCVAAEGGKLSCRAVVGGNAAVKLEETFFRGSKGF